MSETIQFDLVAPERKLASTAATAVVIPGAAGEMTARPNHMPVLTLLRPGFLTVSTADGDVHYAVTGGFAEISPTAVSVLAEDAMEGALLTKDEVQRRIAETQKAMESADLETRAQLESYVLELMNLSMTMN